MRQETTQTMSTCLFCGYPERNYTVKFCASCRSTWSASQAVDKPADVHRYVDSLYQSVQSSQIDEGTEKMIERMRERFKISHATHQRILEDLLERLKIVEEMHAFTLEFNQNDSDAYAEQDTLLQFRLINDPQGQQLKSVELTWNDSDLASGRVFRASTSIPVRPGSIASLQGSHVFMRFGPKSIDRMQLRVELPWGDVGLFMVEPMVFNVRNPDQKINKNVTNIINQERGVVDNSTNLNDADGSGLTVGRQAIWSKVSLVPIVQKPDDISDLIISPVQIEPSPEPFIAEKATVNDSPAPAPSAESQKTVKIEPQPEEIAQVVVEPKIVTPADVAGQGAETAFVEVASKDGQAGAETTHISSNDPRECAIQIFKRLAWFAQASPVTKPDTVISSDRFDLDFIEAIYLTVPDANEDDVLGMIFVDADSVVFDQHDCVTNFDGTATVFTLSGVTELTCENNIVNAEAFHSWAKMDSMGWSFYRRRFGDDKFVVSFGDGSVSQNLPGCKFDLRQYKGEKPVTQVFEEGNAWLSRLYEITPPLVLEEEAVQGEQESLYEEAAWPFDSSSSSEQDQLGGQDTQPSESSSPDALTYQDEDEDEDEDEENETYAQQQRLDEIGNRMQGFFSKLDFVIQHCDENQARCIFTRDRVDEDLLQSLHECVYNTGSGMRVVCLEPGCAILNSAGILIGFNGSASVLCAEGIFHMVGNTAGDYRMDGANSFLSWTRFFIELQGGLMVREEGPDLWFGNAMNYLIRGCYVDYSNQVLQWDYFENYVQKDLTSDLAYFKESVDWL